MREIILTRAQKCAHKYRKRCRWVDFDEFVSVANLAGVRAAKTFNPNRGVDAGAYIYRAMILACSNHARRSSSPASATSHQLNDLNLAQHGGDAVTLLQGQQAASHTYATWNASVANTAIREAKKIRYGLLALEVLSDLATPDQIAAREKIPVRRVYAARVQLAGRLRQNSTLQTLHKENESHT